MNSEEMIQVVDLVKTGFIPASKIPDWEPLIQAVNTRVAEEVSARDKSNSALALEVRRLREALEPFAKLAKRFEDKILNVSAIEDSDQIRVEYMWAEFRSFIRVGDLRRAALAPAVAQEKENEG